MLSTPRYIRFVALIFADSFSVFFDLSTLADNSEVKPFLRADVRDREIWLYWDEIEGATDYKLYFEPFPSENTSLTNTIVLGSQVNLYGGRATVYATLEYGDRYTVAVSAFFESDESKLSNPRLIQIDEISGEYFEEAAEFLSYRRDDGMSYTGLPAYAFTGFDSKVLFMKQYISHTCFGDSPRCGDPAATLIYEFDQTSKRFIDVTNDILVAGDYFSIPPLREAVVADFNGDGADDIAFANHTEGKEPMAFPWAWNVENYILLSTPSKKYEIRQLNSKIDYAHSIAASDVDGDGDIDIYMGSSSQEDEGEIVTINDQWGGYFLTNDGSGNFSRSEQRITYGTAHHFVDLDNDGFDELVSTQNNRECTGNPGVCRREWGLRIYKRNEKGEYDLVGSDISAIPNEVTFPAEYAPGFPSITLEDGKVLDLAYMGDVVSLDVNSDGLEDLLVLTNSHTEGYEFLSFLINKGDFNFELDTTRLQFKHQRVSTLFIEVVDIDVDGDDDILLQRVNGSHSDFISNEIFYNDGSGRFTNYNELRLPAITGTMEPADVDKDGDMDIILTTGWDDIKLPENVSSIPFRLWLNN